MVNVWTVGEDWEQDSPSWEKTDIAESEEEGGVGFQVDDEDDDWEDDDDLDII